MKEPAPNPRRRKYDEDFKQNALKMIEQGQSVRSVAQSLGVSENLLHKWKQVRHSNRSDLETENAELRARLRQVEQEREILKKVYGSAAGVNYQTNHAGTRQDGCNKCIRLL